MLITAKADPDVQTPSEGRALRIDVYVQGPVDGGQGHLTIPPDGRRIGFLTLRAHRAKPAYEAAPGLWHRRVIDDEGEAWILTCTSVRGKEGVDSLAAVRELRGIEGAELTCQLLALRIGRMVLDGAALPIQVDSAEPAEPAEPAGPVHADLPITSTPALGERSGDVYESETGDFDLPGLFSDRPPVDPELAAQLMADESAPPEPVDADDPEPDLPDLE